MKLQSVKVTMFRNIVDSTEVQISPSVTCFVGKNESGKTAFLHALNRLNPARPNVKFSVPDHYPAWLEKKDKLRGQDLEAVTPISAVFRFEENDLKILHERFGKDTILNATEFTLSKSYKNSFVWTLKHSEQAFVEHLVEIIRWPRGTKTEANTLKTVADLQTYAAKIKETDDPDGVFGTCAESISAELINRLGKGTLSEAIWSATNALIPKFFYASEYSSLPYSVPIDRLLQDDTSDLEDNELTARALLKLAAAEDEYLTNPDYERRKRELENVANAITQDVLKYWTQNPELRVMPDITQKTETSHNGRTSVLDELKIRVWDNRHQLSLPFNEHSTGFQWFFSFLAAFAEYEFRSDPIIILLDEPAHGLHAKAQSDFLRFIEERLAVKCQVLYTTHSPFMVQPGKLEHVRLVEDKGQLLGTKITADITSTDPDTLFPLQGALGYDLVQNLFIAPNNLVVEGTSDFTYFRVLSDYFKELGNREALNDKWSIIPVGSVDAVPTFVALLGNHLDLTVVIDAQKGGQQRLSRMAEQGILAMNRILTIGLILGKPEADIEDLFSLEDYLALFNNAFGKQITTAELVGTDPIVRRLARHQKQDRFDHGQPADYFLRHRDEILPKLSSTTLDQFESLFRAINATFPKK